MKERRRNDARRERRSDQAAVAIAVVEPQRRRRRLYWCVYTSTSWLLFLLIVLVLSSASPFPSVDAGAAAVQVDYAGNIATKSQSNKHELEVSDDHDMNNHHQQQHDAPSEFPSQTNAPIDDDENDEKGIIVVVAVDGSIAGLSRRTGEVIWKQNGVKSADDNDDASSESRSSNRHHEHTSNNDNKMHSGTGSNSNNKVLRSPLVSTTTTTKSSRPGDDWRTAAVPAIDGRVFLTAGRRDAGTNDDMTATSTLKELVARAPFVDARERFYVGSRHSTATAICQETGAILRVVSGDGEAAAVGFMDAASDSDNFKGRNIIWVGRVDYSISLFVARSGVMDVKFASSEIMGVHDMVSDDGGVLEDNPTTSLSESSEQQHNSHAAPRLLLPNNNNNHDTDLLDSEQQARQPSMEKQVMLVATPNGNVALRNPATGAIQWVSNETFDTPIAFALESSTGRSLGVDILPDAPVPSSSPEYLATQLDRQIDVLIRSSPSQDQEPEQTIVGALANGQLFAMPLGKRLSRERVAPATTIGLPHHHHATTTTTTSIGSKTPIIGNSKVPNLGGGGRRTSQNPNHHQHNGKADTDHQLSALPKKTCGPTSVNYPACLVGGIHHNQDISGGGPSFLDHSEENSEHHHPLPPALLPFQLKHEQDLLELQQFRKTKRHFFKLMESWLPPTMLLIFVLSFELGRRLKAKKRSEREASKSSLRKATSSDNLGALSSSGSGARSIGAITVSDTVLGFGGHGTVVYRGTLDGRQVAVKRMLKAYHASADREIALLIESDGHPNVVRYFFKEIKGDFVYLALELCDMSLHDLLVKLRQSSSSGPMKPEVAAIVKATLYQIACGVRHLHSLRIVHRDLKPANILLASRSGKKAKAIPNKDAAGEDTVLAHYENGDYVAKISDMGLGKQLAGQSSFGLSTLGNVSIQGAAHSGESSRLTGAGPGSVGWQAPEVMAIRFSSETASVKSNGSSIGDSFLPDASPLDATMHSRTSRAVDIFSLGCIFHCTLLPGTHPFGDWYEREANIMRNRASTEELLEASPAAHDLITSMICRNASLRLNAKEVCEHPLFWSAQQKLAFLCDISDRIESGFQSAEESPEGAARHRANIIAMEQDAVKVVGTAWDQVLDPDLVSNVSKFRTYDPSSVRDCLRLIRNKHHHYDELPAHVKEKVGPNPDGLLTYFEHHFPHLVMHCYKRSKEVFERNDSLALKYSISHSNSDLAKRQVSTQAKVQIPTTDQGMQESQQSSHSVEAPSLVEVSSSSDKDIQNLISSSLSETEKVLLAQEGAGAEEAVQLESSEKNQLDVSNGNIVIWEGSTSAKVFNCRGWLRGDDEWTRRVDATLKKLDSNMTRCATDAKFRTRLCNHWDVSLGTFCPMKKRNKCVFAHGPVELRVKEGKKNRWGRLVDKSGNNSNLQHSGGEDTFGAARSIETIRKEEGKWNTENAKKGKPRAKGKQHSTKVAVSVADKKLDCPPKVPAVVANKSLETKNPAAITEKMMEEPTMVSDAIADTIIEPPNKAFAVVADKNIEPPTDAPIVAASANATENSMNPPAAIAVTNLDDNQLSMVDVYHNKAM